MDWATIGQTFIGAGLGSGVVTLVVQVLFPILRDCSQRKRQATYMAMRLAVTLESFALECSNVIEFNDNPVLHADDGESDDYNFQIPPLTSYPDDPDGWKAIDRELASKSLELKNRLLESQSIIEGARTSPYDESPLGVAEQHIAKRGLEAWNLAVELRKKYNIKRGAPEWNFPDALQEVLDRIARSWERQREQSERSSGAS